MRIGEGADGCPVLPSHPIAPSRLLELDLDPKRPRVRHGLCAEIMFEQDAELDDTKEGHLALSPSPRNMSFGDRQKIAALVLFIPPDENEEAAAGGNDIAVPQRWIVHDTVRGFRFQGIRRRRGGVCVRALATKSSERRRAASTRCCHCSRVTAPSGNAWMSVGVLAVSWAKQRQGLTVRSPVTTRTAIRYAMARRPSIPAEGLILAVPTVNHRCADSGCRMFLEG